MKSKFRSIGLSKSFKTRDNLLTSSDGEPAMVNSYHATIGEVGDITTPDVLEIEFLSGISEGRTRNVKNATYGEVDV
jgi:hypothetical protein